MTEPSEDWLRVLEMIRDGDRAWCEPRAIAAALREPVEPVLDRLADMHVAGWLEVWERDDDVVVTLSPRAASRLGLTLVSQERRDQWRWVACEHSCASSSRPLRSSPSNAMAASLAEPVDGPRAESGVIEPDVGPPTLLVGSGLCPWPGPREPRPPAACPACGGVRLRPNTYCLRCDRWSGDGPAAPAASRGLPGRPSPPGARPFREQRDRRRRPRRPVGDNRSPGRG